MLNGYLWRGAGEGQHPAVIFLHGCGGLFLGSSGVVEPGESETTEVPLLVLVGAEDVGIPAVPCKTLLDDAAGRAAKVEMQIYPGAYHHFDWPNLPRRELPFRTADGLVRIEGTDPAARQDAFSQGPVLPRPLPVKLNEPDVQLPSRVAARFAQNCTLSRKSHKISESLRTHEGI
jgi:dienelactone hydrolase